MVEPVSALMAAGTAVAALTAGMAFGAWRARSGARGKTGDGGTADANRHQSRADLAERWPLGKVMRSLPNGTLHIVDRTLRIRLAEGEALSRFGLSHDAVGRSLRESFPAEAARRLEPALRRTLLGHNQRLTVTLRDTPALAACAPLRDDGAVVAAVLVLQDVAEQDALRNRAEASRLDAERKLADITATHRELETFAEMARRDLRDPMRLLAAYLTVVRKRHGKRLDPDGRLLLRQAEGNARRLERILDDVLDYARLNGDRAPRRPVPLADALGGALRHLSPRLRETGAHVDISDPLPVVEAVPEQMQRLFQQVLDHAVRNRRVNVPPIICIGCRPDGPAWRISVTDNGCGIPAAERDRLSEPFAAVTSPDGEQRRPGKGGGIHLAIARRIVELHGGHMWIMPDAAASDAQPRYGCTVCFTLPADRSHQHNPSHTGLLGLRP